jgi:hypothetical protein
MLLVPYSSIIATMLWRKPVRIEATTIAVITPTTIPRIVKALRNLLARILSKAIRKISIGIVVESFIFSFGGTARPHFD